MAFPDLPEDIQPLDDNIKKNRLTRYFVRRKLKSG